MIDSSILQEKREAKKESEDLLMKNDVLSIDDWINNLKESDYKGSELADGVIKVVNEHTEQSEEDQYIHIFISKKMTDTPYYKMMIVIRESTPEVLPFDLVKKIFWEGLEEILDIYEPELDMIRDLGELKGICIMRFSDVFDD